MANISSTDNLYISASSMGRQFYNSATTGIESIGDIFSLLRRMPGAPRGMVTVTVRNASQGWAQSRSLYL